jgi:hypothetical protein
LRARKAYGEVEILLHPFLAWVIGCLVNFKIKDNDCKKEASLDNQGTR